MENLILYSMKMIRDFALKSAECVLTEYETLMYEQSCKMIENFSKLHVLYYEKAIMEAERDLEIERKKHEKWIIGDQNDSGADAAPVS